MRLSAFRVLPAREKQAFVHARNSRRRRYLREHLDQEIKNDSMFAGVNRSYKKVVYASVVSTKTGSIWNVRSNRLSDVFVKTRELRAGTVVAPRGWRSEQRGVCCLTNRAPEKCVLAKREPMSQRFAGAPGGTSVPAPVHPFLRSRNSRVFTNTLLKRFDLTFQCC